MEEVEGKMEEEGGEAGVKAIPEQVVWRAVWGLLKSVPEKKYPIWKMCFQRKPCKSWGIGYEKT